MERIRTAWHRGSVERTQVGLVVFEDDPVSAPTFQQLLDPMGIDVQSARIGFPIAGEDVAAFAARLAAAAATILPSAAPAAIGFACTTGAIDLGPERLKTAMARPGAVIEAVTPIDSVVAALHRIGARRVAIVSPYPAPMSDQVAEHIEVSGFTVSRLCYFDAGNADIAAISSDSIVAAARDACWAGDPDALFLSCTGLRATPLVTSIETELGIAVLTSLQVMAWRVTTLLGYPAYGRGRLFNPAGTGERLAPSASLRA